MKNNTVVIVDYGSQYTQLIARRIREENVHSIIIPYDFRENYIQEYNIVGIILSGGPSSVYEKNSPQLNEIIFS
jgi:GMP synthase (glutamine-hydrolysing)